MLHSKSGNLTEMDALIGGLTRVGVKFVSVVGDDCENFEDIIDEMVWVKATMSLLSLRMT